MGKKDRGIYRLEKKDLGIYTWENDSGIHSLGIRKGGNYSWGRKVVENYSGEEG